MPEKFEAMAREFMGFQCIHDNSVGDAGGQSSWCSECLAALLARVDRERAEADCKAVCEYCREPKWKNIDTGESGSWSKPTPRNNYFVHLSQGIPPRICAASVIRSTLATAEKDSDAE